MTESLNYILKRIDWEYLTKNAESLKDGKFTCLKEENLPCNCIPGVIINFSAFLTTLFLKENVYDAKLEISGSNGYIRCCKGSVKLFPIENQESDDESYVLENLICPKSVGESAYFPFPHYSELPDIEKYLRNEAENPSMYPSDSVRLELSIRLLSSMRTRPLCQSSRIFLFMAAYLCPSRTLKLMYKAHEEVGKDWLRQFMLDYVTFLRDIENDTPLGFNQRLNASFRTAVGFDIAAFLENLKPAGKIYEQMLISSYKNNLTELSRNSTPLSRIRQYISDAEIDGLVASLAKRHIDFTPNTP